MTTPLEDLIRRCSTAPTLDVEGARLETTTVLPDGGLVTVSIVPQGDSYRVSDDSQGLLALLSLGAGDLTRGDARRGLRIAESFGLKFDGQGFSVEGVSLDRMNAAVVYVAEAARAWTQGALESRHDAARRTLVDRVESRIRESAPGLIVERERPLQGASSKQHRFDLVVMRGDEPRAVFETLTPFAGSIAAAHLKFFDLEQARPHCLREGVVEDFTDWEAPDLVLMQQVSSHLRPLSSPWGDLAALVA